MLEAHAATLWWMVSGALVICELITGTLYLLMLALGAAVGALASYVGLSVPSQIAIAAIVSAGAVLARYRKRIGAFNAGDGAIQSSGLDVGAIVRVNHWEASGGCGRAQYRGAPWLVRLKDAKSTASPQAGNFKIVAIEGNTLIVEEF